MNEKEEIKVILDTLETVCKSFSSFRKTVIICITIFACIWWITYMFTPYLTRNYVSNSNNIKIEGE